MKTVFGISVLVSLAAGAWADGAANTASVLRLRETVRVSGRDVTLGDVLVIETGDAALRERVCREIEVMRERYLAGSLGETGKVQTPEPNQLVENAKRYQLQALLIVNGNRSAANYDNPYPELADLFEAIGPLLDREAVPLANLIVIHDDLDLAGRLAG